MNNLNDIEAAIEKWDQETEEYRKAESIARQNQTAITNRKLELAKRLRDLADKLDPPKRRHEVIPRG